MEKQKLPNAQIVLILGILSIITCCCYGFGLVLGIIALVLAKKDMELYRMQPETYSNYSNLNTGRVLAIIGISMSVIYLIVLIYMLTTMGYEGMMQMQQEALRNYGAA